MVQRTQHGERLLEKTTHQTKIAPAVLPARGGRCAESGAAPQACKFNASIRHASTSRTAGISDAADLAHSPQDVCGVSCICLVCTTPFPTFSGLSEIRDLHLLTVQSTRASSLEVHTPNCVTRTVSWPVIVVLRKLDVNRLKH